MTRHRPLALCAALACAAPSSWALPAQEQARSLNDTGIGFCIDAQGRFIGCKGTGQDAASGRDVTSPHDADGRVGFHFARYCNSGERAGQGSCPALPPPGDAPDDWGCTFDVVTRLLWETKTGSGWRAGSNAYTFYSEDFDPDGQFGGPGDATGFMNGVNAAGLCGLHDWRLPTPTELMGIVDMGVPTPPAIDERFMPNTRSDLYWAAGSVLGVPSGEQLAWGSDFAFTLGDVFPQFRSVPRPVRLVRGTGVDGKRFVVSSDRQEVSDRQTGLTWRRCIEGTSIVEEVCVGTPLALTWTRALEHAKHQAHQGSVGWRLPNVKELASLLDHEHLPHVDVKAFPGAQDDMLWTSSSFPTDPTPRCVDFADATTFSCSQESGASTFRLVRGSD